MEFFCLLLGLLRGDWVGGFMSVFFLFEDWDIRRLMSESWDIGVTKTMRR